MITPKEIKEKAERPFYKIVSSLLKGESVFPWIIPSNKQITGSNYSDWKKDLVPLHQQSKESKGKGYSVEWKNKKINGSTQSIPAKIYFETFNDYLDFINRNRDYENIKISLQLLVDVFPLLKEWAESHPDLLLKYHESWPSIIAVCQYLVQHKPPHDMYVREIPVSVHSKFIEDNSAILKRILDMILPAEWIFNVDQNFATRYGFKRPNVHTQIRVLDDALKPELGYEECSLPIDDAAWLKWLPQKVFIIENQVCYLTFPKVKNAVAIFGKGFESRLARHIPWLKRTQLYCWFDLDAAGFEMLNMVREHYPNASSFLMDNVTFNSYSQYHVYNKNRFKKLPLLNSSEKALYNYIVENNLRLEQERILQKYVLKMSESLP
jgi:hypothetical protein